MNTRQVVTLTPAYLLHARPYRDSSVIAEFFTRDYGRIALVARGARRPKSKNRSSLRPFRSVLLSWTSRSSLGTLTALEPNAAPPLDLGKGLLSAYYINELILRALKPGDSHSELFTLYDNALVQIANAPEQSVLLRRFELKLLQLLGYGLPLEFDGAGQPIQEQEFYEFDMQSGFIQTGAEFRPGVYSGKTLLSLLNGGSVEKQTAVEAKALLRQALDLHLGVQASNVRNVLSAMHLRKKSWVIHRDTDDDQKMLS